MRFRSLIFVLLTLIVASTAAAAMAEGICGCLANEVRQRQCWPEPYLSADRAVATAPFAIQVANGWRKQNMLGEYHFQQGTGQLTEAGRLKVRWILQTGPKQHRLLYVHSAGTPEETDARIAAVEQLASRLAPGDVPPILSTTIADDGWPADQVDAIGRQFREKAILQLELPGYPHGSAESPSVVPSGGT